MSSRLALGRLTLGGLTVGALAGLLVAGCSHPQICKDIGAQPGVLFTDVAAALPDDSTYQVHACADTTCTDWSGTRSAIPSVTVVLPNATAGQKLTATMSVTGPAGRIFNASLPVTLTELRPNGARCDPVVYQAQLRPTIHGDLVAA